MENLSNDFDWNGSIENEQSTVWQLDLIDTLLINANLDQELKDRIHLLKFQYSYNDANETIEMLKDNQYEQKPEKQWQNRMKRNKELI